MKQTSIIQRLCLFLFALLLTPAWTYGEEIKISTKDDWKAFCWRVNTGATKLNAVLENDINLGTEISMLGRDDNYYEGTLDGKGHSITIDWTTKNIEIALLRYVKNATIRNLHVKGSITTHSQFGKISGMLWKASGNTNITSCSSMVNLTAPLGEFCNAEASGLVGQIDRNSNLKINDCMVGGKFSGGIKEWYGFVNTFGGVNNTCELNDCLYIGEANPNVIRSYTFFREDEADVTFHNCYYLNPCGKAQGEKVTEEKLKNGYVTHKLQKGRNETFWGQDLEKDNMPMLTADETKKVHKVHFILHNNMVKATRYANHAKSILGSMPTVQEILRSLYDPSHYYTLAFSENFTNNTVVTTDKLITVYLTDSDHFGISSAQDWKKFCEMVNGGQHQLNAKLTQDIDLGTELSMVGTETNMYSGTFDGQGHSITVNWNTDQSKIALFRNINEATIKNLHTKGSITTSNDIGEISGMVWSVAGRVKLTNCSSMVNLTATGIQANSAGMIGSTIHNSYSELTDCLVGGKFSGNTSSLYGFIRYRAGWCVLKNCLYIGENPEGTTSHTFVMDGKGVIDNCYYLNPCGKAQGEKVTAEQLKSGYVAHKLQGSRKETFWGQHLKRDNNPMPTADVKKKVHRVYFTYNNIVKEAPYVNHGKTVNLPTVQDILGSSHNPRIYYAFNFSGNFTPSTPINDDETIAITFTEHDHFAINSLDDWKKFREVVENGQNAIDAKLTKDINLSTAMLEIGTNENQYSGTFDGQGHSITMNWKNTREFPAAIFYCLNGAVIQNLHTKGSMTSNSEHARISGMVWNVYGAVKLMNCSSMINIKTAGRYSYSAGMVGYTNEGSNVKITDCVVGGEFSDESAHNYGFVRYVEGGYELTNCLYIGKAPANTTGHTFAREGKGRIDNCYYLNKCGQRQGERINEDQLNNGEVANKLQAERDTQFWGQTLGQDRTPLPTSNVEKRVYKVDFKYNNNVLFSRYANKNKSIHGSLPTLQNVLGSSYDSSLQYELSFSENFNASTIITDNKVVYANVTLNIGSPAEWQKFCEMVNGGHTKLNAKLTKGIDLEGNLWMVGTEANKYSGTVDGQNYSITVNWNNNDGNMALFRSVNEGCQISNLHTKGSITSDGFGKISGMVREVYGQVKITNCSSMVNITVKGKDANSAGMVGYTAEGSRVELTDCMVGGKFSGSTKDWYAFIRISKGWCKLTNCLYIGETPAGATGNTFVTDMLGLLTNCLYLNACGTAQGEQISEDQLKNGYAAHKLQAGRNNNVWGQELGKDNNPLLTAETSKRVHRVEFRYNDKVWATHYVNNGKTVTPPTVQNIVGSSYDPHHYYELAFSDGFSPAQPVTADKTIAITFTEHDHFAISSPDDWQKFSEIVNGGQTGVDAKLTEDIYIKDNDIMVGTNENPYRGTFDGQHHSIRISWNPFRKEENGLFAYIDGATILNLHSLGSIITNHTDYHTVSGMVCQARGNVTLTGCSSMVKITQTKHRSSNAGLISNLTANSHATLNDCLVGEDFSEMYHNEGKYNLWCGFVNAHDNASTTLNNCLFIARKVSLSGEVIIDFKDDYTFANGNVTLNNCYFLNALDKEQGKKITEEQLKSGYVTKLLQAGRTDKCYWEQTLGEMPKLYNPDGIGTNRIWWDTYKQTWYCGDFHISGYMPIGLDFEADDVMFDYNTAPDGLYTISVPFDWWMAGQAYTLASVSGNVAHFQEVTNDENYKANTPYLFKAIYTNSVIYARKSYVKATPETPVTIEKNGVKFTACYAGMSNEEAAAAGAYILQGDKQWHKVTTANTAAVIPPYRAYLTLPATSEAKTLSISFDDETTGISAIETTDLDGTVHYYDLNGRYIGTSLDGQPRGVYVGNGKKVVKK